MSWDEPDVVMVGDVRIRPDRTRFRVTAFDGRDVDVEYHSGPNGRDGMVDRIPLGIVRVWKLDPEIHLPGVKRKEQ